MEIGSIQPLTKTMTFTDHQPLPNSTPVESNPQTTNEKVPKKDIESEIEGINKWLQSRGTHLKFTLHEKLHEYYVQIINDETNEVIREIPPKKILDIAAKLQEMIGLLVDEKR